MLQKLHHLFFSVVHIHQVLMSFANFVANFELFIPILLTHVPCKVFEITAWNINHLLLRHWLACSFRFDFSCWPFILHCLFAIETSVFFTILLLRITMRKFRRHVFLVSIVISLLQICYVLLIFKVKKGWVVVLIEIFLWWLVLLCLLYF